MSNFLLALVPMLLLMIIALMNDTFTLHRKMKQHLEWHCQTDKKSKYQFEYYLNGVKKGTK